MTVNISLRPVLPQDIDDFYCSWYENSDGHLVYFTGSGRKFSKEILIEDYNDGIKSGRWFYYLIEADGGIPVGNVKIGPIDVRNKTSDLVCLIGNRDYVGKGLASQAISKANLIAFDLHDVRRLQGGMYENNVSSIKAYTRAGWFVEAVMKGFYLVDDEPQDRICVACLNPKYFPDAGGSNE